MAEGLPGPSLAQGCDLALQRRQPLGHLASYLTAAAVRAKAGPQQVNALPFRRKSTGSSHEPFSA